MNPRVLYFFCFLLAVFGGNCIARADQGPITYGDLMVEDHSAIPKRTLEMSAGYDVTNPYLNTYNFGLTYLQTIHPLFDLGLETLAFVSGKSQYNKNVENDLNVFGIQADEDRPQYSVFAVLQLKLLKGRVNLFSLRALPFVFAVRAGAGEMWFQEKHPSTGGTWGFLSELFFNSSWGAALHFDQDLQSLFGGGKIIYRHRLSFSAVWAF